MPPTASRGRATSSSNSARAAPLETPSIDDAAARPARETGRDARVVEFPVAASMGRAAYVAGTFDTKGRELMFLRGCLEKLGVRTVTVDLATSGKPSPAMVHPREVARHHPKGERAVFTGDRGSSVEEMAVAFAHYVTAPPRSRRDHLRRRLGRHGARDRGDAPLPIGVPKVMVSTVASGDVKPYVGPADICMMYSVTDIAGINRISEKVLVQRRARARRHDRVRRRPQREASDARPALGLTMFGLTTPCVQAVTRRLEGEYDCLVFHATGTGGQSMEKLAESGLLDGVIDVTTTEITDEIVGGVLSAGPGPPGRVRARRRFPTSDRAARSTCAISGRSTRCRSDSAAGGCTGTIRT